MHAFHSRSMTLTGVIGGLEEQLDFGLFSSQRSTS